MSPPLPNHSYVSENVNGGRMEIAAKTSQSKTSALMIATGLPLAGLQLEESTGLARPAAMREE